MPLPPGTHAYDPLWPGLTWEDDNPAYPASAERFSQVSDQVKGLTARVSGGSGPPVSYYLKDDGTTSKAYDGRLGDFAAIDSDTDSSALAQRIANRMDPLNGGSGGGLFICKPSAGNGYRWNAAVRLPLELSGSQQMEVAAEAGTVFKPQTNAAFPLFVNHRTATTVGTSGFTDDATIYLASLTGANNGKAFPASGSVSVGSGSHLVAYGGVASDSGGGGPRLTGCTYAGNASLTIGTGNAALTYTAVTAGGGGTAVTIAYVIAGNNTPLSIGVVGNAITVNVATDGGGAATSTALQVLTAIRASAAASALVNVMLAGSTGATVVAAAAAAALSTHFATTTATNVVLNQENHKHTTIRLRGSTIDCTNLAGLSGSTAIIYGQLVGGGATFFAQRLNILDVHVDGGRLINAPNDRIHYPTFFATLQRGPGEPTQNTMRDLSVRGIRAGTEATPAGASTAIAIAGKSILDPFVCINAYIDEYVVTDNHLYSTYSAGYAGISSVQVGGTALTGTGWVYHNKFVGGFDLAVEIDNVQKASHVKANAVEDLLTEAVLFYVFTGGTATTGRAYWECSGNHLRQIHQTCRYMRLYTLPQNQEESFNGTLVDRNNSLDWLALSLTTSSGITGAYLGASGVPIKGNLRVIQEGNTIDIGSGITLSGSASFFAWQVFAQAGSSIVVSGGAPNIVRGSLTYAAAATGNIQGLQTAGPVEFDGAMYEFDVAATGSQPASALRAFRLGNGAGSTLAGFLRAKTRAASGGTNPIGMQFGSAANLTFPKPFSVAYDGSGLATTASEITYDATSVKGLVRFTLDSIFKTTIVQAGISPAPGGANGTGDIDNVGHPTTVTNATGTWYIGEGITGTGIPAATTITQISGTPGALTLTLSASTTAATAGLALSKASPFMYQNNNGYYGDFTAAGGTGVVVKLVPDISALGSTAPTLYTTVLSSGPFRLSPRGGIQLAYSTVPSVNFSPVYQRADP